MKQWLTSLGKKFADAIARKPLLDEDMVVYAGTDDPTPETKAGEFEFGIYVNVRDQDAIWLPAVADKPDVVAQLKAMQPGQSFRITGEESEGGLGTRITSLEIPKDAPVFKFGKNKPATVTLG